MAAIALPAFVASLLASALANPIQARETDASGTPAVNQSTTISLAPPAANATTPCWTIASYVGGVPLDLCFDTATQQTYLDISKQNVTQSWNATLYGSFYDSNLDVIVSGPGYVTAVNISSLYAPQQAVGVTNYTLCAECSNGQGLFGFGHTSTLMDELIFRGQIPNSNVIGFDLPDPASGSNGSLTLGGFDSSAYTGELMYVDAMDYDDLETSDMSWRLFAETIVYGSKSYTSNDPYEVIIDAREPDTKLPYSVFTQFIHDAGFTGPDLTATSQPAANLTITMGSTQLVLTPDQYAVENNGTWTTWIGSNGDNFLLGQKFMQYYYIVLDATFSTSVTAGRVGFALKA